MVNEQAVGDAARHYAQVISALHRFDLPESEHWKPHESQLLIGNAVFKRGCKFIFVQCGRKFGKDLPLSTPIATPDRGFIELGKLKEGDLIFGDDGKPTRIIGLSQIRTPKTYELIFSDGTKLKASDTHRWLTKTRKCRKSGKDRRKQLRPQIVTTEEIKNTLKVGREWNHSIDNTKALNLERKNLPIDPYVLGVWLGDGSSHGATITGIDGDIFDNIRMAGYEVNQHKHCVQSWGVKKLLTHLRESNLLKNKHIPHDYLWASIDQRIALIRGLMDTDGFVDKYGNCFFYNTNENLALGLKQLVESLGEKSTITTKKTYRKDCFVVYFKPSFDCFGIKRKSSRLKPKKKPNHRFIVSVTEVTPEPSRCIAVDNESHLYLAGTSFVPTHNTEIIVYCLWRWALMNPGSSCYYICPELKQAKEIIWKARDQRGRLRIQEFGPQEYIESIDNTELRITFKNGSFIKCDGSDNWAAWKGISPNFIVLDEFAEFKPEFYGAMNPNRATFDAPMVIIGTPPEKIWLDRDKPHQYVELAQECRQQMMEDPNDAFWIKRPSWCNPLPNIQNFLRKEKKVLFRMGKEDEWWRDYGAELVPAKARKIFPNFIADSTVEGSHVIAHDLMITQMSEYCGAR